MLQDTIKVRLQTQQAGAEVYSGMMDCFRKTFAEEGLGGLYKGAASPLAGAMFHNAGLFLINGLGEAWLMSLKKEGEDKVLTVGDQFVAGAIAGGGISVVETPIDLFKVQLQIQKGSGEGAYSGVFDAASKVYRAHGLRGCFQGFTATTLRNVPAFSGYFGAFSYVSGSLTPEGELPSVPTAFVAGGSAGFAFWGVIYPLEMIKTTMQSQNPDPAKRVYATTLHAIKGEIAKGGIRALFKGYLPAVVRAVPVNASIFAGFSFTKRLLSGNGDDDDQ